MVRFLEREGYDVTYCTDVDTHAGPNLLLSHNAFLVVGHDEYWSWQMRNNVEAARDQGINLGFFCGNSCWWQIRFESSQVTGDQNRTIVCYKSTDDPVYGTSSSYLTTVNWPNAPVNRPENTMIGLGYGYWGPNEAVNNDIVISDASHWVCTGTGLKNGDHLPGLIGYEADDRLPGSPSGTISISHSPVCCGDTYDTGYSDMTMYQAPSGATVFATGTIQWSWGLDDYNADSSVGPVLRPSRLNSDAQQITRNVLDVFSRRVIFVNGSYSGGTADGSIERPFPTVAAGHAAALDGDTIRVAQGDYPETGALPLKLNKAIQVRPWFGTPRIGSP